jgi:hypothetical protein
VVQCLQAQILHARTINLHEGELAVLGVPRAPRSPERRYTAAGTNLNTVPKLFEPPVSVVP